MKRTGFILGLSLIVSVTMFGQKKAVTDALKLAKAATPNYAEALTKIKSACENEETKNDAKTWFTVGQIADMQFSAETAKLQIGQPANEPVMYSALREIYPPFIKAYELDKLPDAKGKVKPKYVKEMKTILKTALPFYINGGVHFFEKKDYKGAYDLFNQYVEIKDGTLIHEGDKPKDQLLEALLVDSNYIWGVYYSAICATMLEDHELAVAAMKRATQKIDYNRNEMYQFLVQEYQSVGDTLNFEKTLDEAHAIFPKESFFLLHLINVYINTGRHEKAIDYIQQAIQNDPNSAQLYDVGGRIYETNFKDYAKAEEYFKKAIELDGENAESQMNLGRIYFNQAVEQLQVADNFSDVTKYKEEKEKAKVLFRKALPYFEKSFKLNPDIGETKFALRNIYYNLEMGDKFDEMEKIIGN
jgi:tetratricopeptide (TPR) repeat protein